MNEDQSADIARFIMIGDCGSVPRELIFVVWHRFPKPTCNN
jgi:hypothetical protein